MNSLAPAHDAAWDRVVDLLIVGGGVAGVSAAIEASDRGAEVLVVEKTGRTGGNCIFSAGNLLDLTGPGALAHLSALCAGKTSDAVLEAYLGGLHGVAAWLRGLGGVLEVLDQDGPDQRIEPCWPHLPGADGIVYYRVAGSGRPGVLLWEILAGAADHRPIIFVADARCEELLTDDTGAVMGARVSMPGGTQIIRARRGVVLATGGFENDHHLCDTYLPITPLVPIGHLGNTGDGLRLAQAAGASLWHMSNFFGRWAYVAPGHEAGFGLDFPAPTYLFVDADGRRFCAEEGHETHDRMRVLTDYLPDRANYPHYPSFVIFDDACRVAGPLSRAQNSNGYEWSADNSAELGAGWITEAEGAHALGLRLGVNPEQLASTIARYNELAGAGRDDDFYRPAGSLRALDLTRLFGMQMRPGVATTCGGPRRDEAGRVLREDGSVISGLYAAGGNGAVWGNLTQHGGGLTDGLVFGRLAAADAVTRSRQSDLH